MSTPTRDMLAHPTCQFRTGGDFLSSAVSPGFDDATTTFKAPDAAQPELTAASSNPTDPSDVWQRPLTAASSTHILPVQDPSVKTDISKSSTILSSQMQDISPLVDINTATAGNDDTALPHSSVSTFAQQWTSQLMTEKNRG